MGKEKICSKCGRCCKYIVFLVPHKDRTPDEDKYYDGRGIRFIRADRTTDHELVPCRCKYLDDNNMCTIWETRPSICNNQKRDKDQRIYKWPGCTGE